MNGLTMHGAQSDDQNVAEIDGHSEVGRKETSGTSPAATTATTEPASAAPAGLGEIPDFSSPRRVDVAGTGGFRPAGHKPAN